MLYRNGRSVAAVTSGRSLNRIIHAVVQPIIDLPDNVTGVRMLAPLELFRLFGVTARAPSRRNDDRYGCGGVLQVRPAKKSIMFVRPVTVMAIDTDLRVNAVLPVPIQGRLLFTVTGGAGLTRGNIRSFFRYDGN